MHVQADAKLNRLKDKTVTLLRGLDLFLETDILVSNIDKRYELPNSAIVFNSMPFELSFLLEQGYLNLDLMGRDISLTEVMNAIHQEDLNKLKAIQAQGKVSFALHVDGSLDKSVSPDISAEFAVSNGSVEDPINGLEIKKIDVRGKFEKFRGKPEKLELNQLGFQTMGQRFNGQLSVINFEKPDLRLMGEGGINLSALHHFFPLPHVRSIAGDVIVHWIRLMPLYHDPGQD